MAGAGLFLVAVPMACGLRFVISPDERNHYAARGFYAATEIRQRRRARRTRFCHARRVGAARRDLACLAAPPARLARQDGGHPLGLWRNGAQNCAGRNRAPPRPTSGGTKARRRLSRAGGLRFEAGRIHRASDQPRLDARHRAGLCQKIGNRKSEIGNRHRPFPFQRLGQGQLLAEGPPDSRNGGAAAPQRDLPG